MKDKTGIAIIVLAIVILILGIPFALNQYSIYEERLQPTTTVTTIPTLSVNQNIFDKHWCREEGSIDRCYQFFANGTYAYGSSEKFGHAEVVMPGQWTITAGNQYEIPDPEQTFSYLDGYIYTTVNPSFGPFVPREYGLIRTRG